VVLRRVLRHSKLREGIAHASRSTAAGARRSTTTRADATHVGWGWELTWSDVPHAQERSSARNEAATKTSSRDEEALRRRATNDQVHAHSNIRVPSLLVTRNKINPLLSLFAFARLDCVDRVGGLYAAGPVGPDAHGIVAQKTWCIVVVGGRRRCLRAIAAQSSYSNDAGAGASSSSARVAGAAGVDAAGVVAAGAVVVLVDGAAVAESNGVSERKRERERECVARW